MTVRKWVREFVRFINHDPRMIRERERSREIAEFDRRHSRPSQG